MQFRILLFLCLSTTALTICSESTLNIQNNIENTENVTSDNNAISTLVAASFLKEVKALISRNTFYDEKNLSIQDKLAKRLESRCTINFHDVKMTIRKEEYEEQDLIIIETELHGTPEDFQYKNILEHEKHTLKFILIKKYLDNFTTAENQNCTSVLIDNQTKTISLPSFLIVSMSNGIMGSQQSYTKERMGMAFITYFTVDEFDSLIQKYYLNNQSECMKSDQINSPTKKTWWLW